MKGGKMEHITKVSVNIERDPTESCDDNWHVSINGTTSGVSSGSGWGSGGSDKGTFAEVLEEAKKTIEQHNVWCDSWYDEETDEHHKKGETYKTELIVNGKSVPFATGMKTLNSFFRDGGNK